MLHHLHHFTDTGRRSILKLLEHNSRHKVSSTEVTSGNLKAIWKRSYPWIDDGATKTYDSKPVLRERSTTPCRKNFHTGWN